MAGSEMRTRRISDEDAHAILSGRAPELRPDLAPLAQSIAEFRSAAHETVAAPSAELAARLQPTAPVQLSSHTQTQPASGAQRRRVTVFSWIAGLGLAAKIALGAGVAVAATTGAAAAGILPPGAQHVFNTVVSSVVPVGNSDEGSTSDPTESPDPSETEHPDNFGKSVSTGAKDPNKDGRTFGSSVSDAAHDNGESSHSPESDNNTGTDK